jgi:hypothetical protein
MSKAKTVSLKMARFAVPIPADNNANPKFTFHSGQDGILILEANFVVLKQKTGRILHVPVSNVEFMEIADE